MGFAMVRRAGMESPNSGTVANRKKRRCEGGLRNNLIRRPSRNASLKCMVIAAEKLLIPGVSRRVSFESEHF